MKLRELFSAALERRLAGLRADTTCYRLSDQDLAGVTVDRFGAVAIMSLYRDAPDEQAIADALLELDGLDFVFVKRRPREARKVANEAPEALAPPRPIAAKRPDAPEQVVVSEYGVQFTIRPANGLSVGLYLDARDARQTVRQLARGKTVLNTFAYTCGFGVGALLGGATRAVNVDASRKVLDWGEENARLNGLVPTRYDFISGDTFDWLARFAKKAQQFELVILDPPGFATTKTSRFTAQRDYHRLVEAAQKVTGPQGLMLALCNVEQPERDFDAQLARGLGSRRHVELERFSASPIDFRRPSALQCRLFELK